MEGIKIYILIMFISFLIFSLSAVLAVNSELEETPQIGPDYDTNPPTDDYDLLNDIRDYFNEGSYRWALVAVEEFRERYPTSIYMPEVLLVEVRANLHLNKISNAYSILEFEIFLLPTIKGSEFELEAIELYIDLYSEIKGYSNNKGIREFIYSVHSESPYDKHHPETDKKRWELLEMAGDIYTDRMKGLEGDEREYYADRLVRNYIKMYHYFDFDPDDSGALFEFHNRLDYLDMVSSMEMSLSMYTLIEYMKGMLYYKSYELSDSEWDLPREGEEYQEAVRDARREKAIEIWDMLAQTYPHLPGGAMSTLALANFDVWYNNDPAKAVERFQSLIELVELPNVLKKFYYSLIDDIYEPAIAISEYRSDYYHSPQVYLKYIVKGCETIDVSVYQVDLEKIYQCLEEFDRVKGDIPPDILKEVEEKGFSEEMYSIERRPMDIEDIEGVKELVQRRSIDTGAKEGEPPVYVYTSFNDLPPGLYAIEASASENITRCLVMLTPLVAFSCADEKNLYVRAVDSRDGSAVDIEEFSLSYFETTVEKERRITKQKFIDVEHTIRDGCLILDLTKLERENKYLLIMETDRGGVISSFTGWYADSVHKSDEGVIYTDRSLYRPGDTVGFKGILREIDYENVMLTPLVGKSVSVVLYDYQENEIWKGDFVTNEFGTFSGEIELTPDIKLGRYLLSMKWFSGKEEGEKPRERSFRFRVEEYELPEYDMWLLPEKNRYLSGEEVVVEVVGRYFFGEGMSNSLVEYEVLRTGERDDSKRYDRDRLKKRGRGFTDEYGSYLIKFKSDYKGKFENTYTINVKLTDPSNHIIEEKTTVKTYKTNRFIQVKTDQYRYHASDTMKITIYTNDWYGEPVSMPVKLSIYEAVRDYYKGFKKVDELYVQDLSTAEDGYAEVGVKLEEAPEYVIIEIKGEDTTGTCIKDSHVVEFVSPDIETKKRLPELKIEVSNDRPELGEEIKLSIESIFGEGTVYLVFVSSEITETDIVNLEPYGDGGHAEVLLQVDERCLPMTDIYGYLIKDGEIHRDRDSFIVRNSLTDLNITVETDKDEYIPGEKAEVRIMCKDDKELPVLSEVSLVAVDESLLELEEYEISNIPESIRKRLIFNTRIQSFDNTRLRGNITSVVFRFPYFLPLTSGAHLYLPDLEEWGVAGKMLYRFRMPYEIKEPLTPFFRVSGIDRLSLTLYTSESYGEIESITPLYDTGAYTGVLSGVVTDNNGNPLATAAVMVLGTGLGAFTRADGSFRIVGVPPGEWVVQVQLIGYSTAQKTGVTVVEGMRTMVNFNLYPAELEGYDITAYGEPLIRRDISSTKRTVSEDYGLAVYEFRQVMNRTAGAIEHITYTGGGLGGFIDEGILVSDEGVSYMRPILRQFFSESPVWIPDMLTDSSGVAILDVDLPDNLTGWRLFTLGVDEGQRIGYGEGSFITTKNIIARLKAPRHLVVGDKCKLTLMAHNYLPYPKDIKMLIDTEGLSHIEGETERVAEVEPDEIGVMEEWVGADYSGDAHLISVALTDEESDAVESVVPVIPHGSEVFQSYAGRLRNTVTHMLKVLDNIDQDTFKGEVILSPSLARSISHGLPYFSNYPYFCIEQTVNRFLLNALLAESAGELGLSESRLSEGLSDAIDQGMEKLYETQTESGGWPWCEGGEPSCYITAYIVDALYSLRDSPFLSESAKKRYDEMYSRAIGYLEEWLKQLNMDEDRFDWELGLYVADVALRVGIGELYLPLIRESVEYYYENRDPLSPMGLVLLASALHELGNEREVDVVIRNLDNTVNYGPDNTLWWGSTPEEGWRWWNDAVETTSKVLLLKMKVEPESDQIPYLIDWLVDQRRGAVWKSTKDSSVAIRAIIEYLLNYPEVTSLIVTECLVDEEMLESLELDPTDYESPDRKLELLLEDFKIGDNELTIRRDSGEGPVFYTISVNYYTEDDYIPAFHGSVDIERDYYIIERYLDDDKFYERRIPFEGEIEVGDEMEVEITIDSPYDFDYVILEDPRPAGLIYTDMDSYYDRHIGAYVELRNERRIFYFERLKAGETTITYRLRAEVPGIYSALPAIIKGMYSPDIGSSTEEKKIEVRE